MSTTGSPRSSRSPSPRPEIRAPRQRALERLPFLIGHLHALVVEPHQVGRRLGAPAEPGAPAKQRVCPAQRDQPTGELEQLAPSRVQIPIEPADLVVLAVGVVVAALRAARSRRPPAASARPARRTAWPAGCASAARAARDVRRRRSRPRRRSSSCRLWSLPSRLSSPLASLCLSLVAHQVVQREAVVRGDEVDAGVGRAAARARTGRSSRRGARRARRSVPPSPCQKRRTASRYRSFHSAQPGGKLPTW